MLVSTLVLTFVFAVVAVPLLSALKCSSTVNGRHLTPPHKTVKFCMDVRVCHVPQQCDGRMGTWIQVCTARAAWLACVPLGLWAGPMHGQSPFAGAKVLTS